MRKTTAILILTVLVSSIPLAFAASGDTPAPTPSPAPAATAVPAPPKWTEPVLTAAPPSSTVTPIAGSAAWEYKTLSCSSNSSFAINSCDQCFDGGSVKVGEKLTGLFDNWTNSSSMTLSAYKEEQKMPNMVRFGDTTWSTLPASEANVWKYSSDIVWVTPPGESKSQFLLAGGQKVKFYDADLWAGYTLEKTNKKAGDLVWLLRFPVVSHTMDLGTASEGPATTHYECVAYKLESATATATPPVATGSTKTPEPSQVTKTKTGPETALLIAAAFFIAFGMMFTLKRKM